MKTLKLKIDGMHCEACEKTLKRALLKINNIKDVDLRYNNEIATIKYDNKINIDEIIKEIQNVGYDASVFEDGNYNAKEINFKKYIEDLKEKNRVEGELIKVAIGALIILSVLEIITYYGFFKNIPEFFNRFGYYLIFLVISVVISATSVWHIKAYGNSFSCMSGMMIGMTSGMISGFLIGLIVGATNGMFIGTVAGILVGVLVGIFTGKCCGIMGVMEGMMAGLMGGLMGAMTSLMMLSDNLKIIIPILVGICAIILISLDYMIYKEVVRDIKQKVNKYSFITFIGLCFIITIIITFIMILGPKSILFQ